jgi:hypothetical protein
MQLEKGQHFIVNSFDLGFTNIQSIDLLIVVQEVNYTNNTLQIYPLPMPGVHPDHVFHMIADWFLHEYPNCPKGKSFVTHPVAFQKLVELKLAVPEDQQ